MGNLGCNFLTDCWREARETSQDEGKQWGAHWGEGEWMVHRYLLATEGQDAEPLPLFWCPGSLEYSRSKAEHLQELHACTGLMIKKPKLSESLTLCPILKVKAPAAP